jgi:hypothetical protein
MTCILSLVFALLITPSASTKNVQIDAHRQISKLLHSERELNLFARYDTNELITLAKYPKKLHNITSLNIVFDPLLSISNYYFDFLNNPLIQARLLAHDETGLTVRVYVNEKDPYNQKAAIAEAAGKYVTSKVQINLPLRHEFFDSLNSFRSHLERNPLTPFTQYKIGRNDSIFLLDKAVFIIAESNEPDDLLRMIKTKITKVYIYSRYWDFKAIKLNELKRMAKDLTELVISMHCSSSFTLDGTVIESLDHLEHLAIKSLEIMRYKDTCSMLQPIKYSKTLRHLELNIQGVKHDVDRNIETEDEKIEKTAINISELTNLRFLKI